MAVGGGGNPHTTEQLLCEDGIFVSIYRILVCLQIFHSEYDPPIPITFFLYSSEACFFPTSVLPKTRLLFLCGTEIR